MEVTPKYLGSIEYDFNPQYAPVFWRNAEQHRVELVVEGSGSMTLETSRFYGMEYDVKHSPFRFDISAVDRIEEDFMTFTINGVSLSFDFSEFNVKIAIGEIEYAMTELMILDNSKFEIVRKGIMKGKL